MNIDVGLRALWRRRQASDSK